MITSGVVAVILVATGVLAAPPTAEQIRRWESQISSSGRVTNVTWDLPTSTVAYTAAGRRWACDLSTFLTIPVENDFLSSRSNRPGSGRGSGRVARGRQWKTATSPDARWTAEVVDHDVVLKSEDGTTREVTSDGTRDVHYGQASWVYGEELDQNDAMWWSPDGKLLAFYRFDETHVPSYYLLRGLGDLHTDVIMERYPKPGDPNPIPEILIYNTVTKGLVRCDLPGEDIYLFNVSWTPSGRELLVSRTDRRQRTLDVLVIDPRSGTHRVVVSETQPTWQENAPTMRFLDDGKRFIWRTERAGVAQYELRHLDGRRLAVLTDGTFPVAQIIDIDEEGGVLFFMGGGGTHPANRHLWRVGLDGTGLARLTPSGATHSVDVSPGGAFFLDTAQSLQSPPVVTLAKGDGEPLATLTTAQFKGYAALGLLPPEPVSCQSGDGITTIHGELFLPPPGAGSPPYPLFVSVYGGPLSSAIKNRFSLGHRLASRGVAVLRVDNRGTVGRSKGFESATYGRLGITDLDDQAAMVTAIGNRGDIDATKVGIMGSSYGGYMSGLALLRYPDLFHVASDLSGVSDWHQYDSIYTERFLGLPGELPGAYTDSSLVELAGELEGDLLIIHGMVDDNVHPSNALSLTEALRSAGKEFDLRLLPNAAHGLDGTAYRTAVEFVISRLKAAPATPQEGG
jgi:dipeptidyl-peptidase-4